MTWPLRVSCAGFHHAVRADRSRIWKLPVALGRAVAEVASFSFFQNAYKRAVFCNADGTPALLWSRLEPGQMFEVQLSLLRPPLIACLIFRANESMRTAALFRLQIEVAAVAADRVF